MIVSIYKETGKLKTGEDVEARLDQLERLEIFSPIMNMDNWFKYFQYIILAYSIDSDFTQMEDDWDKTKRVIANKVGLSHDETFEDIILLKEPNVTEAILNYLEYQGERDYKHLIMLKETYNRMLFYNLYGSDTEMEQQAKNVKHARNILDEIQDFEATLIQKFGSDKVSDQQKGLKTIGKKKQSTTMSMLNVESIIGSKNE